MATPHAEPPPADERLPSPLPFTPPDVSRWPLPVSPVVAYTGSRAESLPSPSPRPAARRALENSTNTNSAMPSTPLLGSLCLSLMPLPEPSPVRHGELAPHRHVVTGAAWLAPYLIPSPSEPSISGHTRHGHRVASHGEACDACTTSTREVSPLGGPRFSALGTPHCVVHAVAHDTPRSGASATGNRLPAAQVSCSPSPASHGSVNQLVSLASSTASCTSSRGRNPFRNQHIVSHTTHAAPPLDNTTSQIMSALAQLDMGLMAASSSPHTTTAASPAHLSVHPSTPHSVGETTPALSDTDSTEDDTQHITPHTIHPDEADAALAALVADLAVLPRVPAPNADVTVCPAPEGWDALFKDLAHKTHTSTASTVSTRGSNFVYSPAELLSPLSAAVDDIPRITRGMSPQGRVALADAVAATVDVGLAAEPRRAGTQGRE